MRGWRSASGRRVRGPAGAAVAALLAAGCASKQVIPLDCVPEDVTLYIDREALAEIPEELRLAPDQDHVLMFKGEGYRSVTIVLESRQGADGGHELTPILLDGGEDYDPALSPAMLCVEPVFVGVDRELELEVLEREPEDAGR